MTDAVPGKKESQTKAQAGEEENSDNKVASPSKAVTESPEDKKQDGKLNEKSLIGMWNVMMRWRKDGKEVTDRIEEEKKAKTEELSSHEENAVRKEDAEVEKKFVLERWRKHETTVKEESYEVWKKKRNLPVKRKANDENTSLQSTITNDRHNGANNYESEFKRIRIKNNYHNSSSDDVLGGKVDHGDEGVRLVGGDGEGGQAVGVQRARATVLSDNTIKRERFGDLSGWVKAGCAEKANKGKFIQ